MPRSAPVRKTNSPATQALRQRQIGVRKRHRYWLATAQVPLYNRYSRGRRSVAVSVVARPRGGGARVMAMTLRDLPALATMAMRRSGLRTLLCALLVLCL